MLHGFIKAKTMWSGAEYSCFSAAPIACPPEFRLQDVLQRALAVEVDDETCMDMDGLLWDVSREARLPNAVNLGPAPLEEGEIQDADVEVDRGDSPVEELEEGELMETNPGPNGRLARRQRYRRKLKNNAFQRLGHHPKPCDVQKHVGNAEKCNVNAPPQDMSFSRCGYQAANKHKNLHNTVHTFEELKQLGYRVVKHIPGVSQPLVDADSGKVFAVVVGLNNDPTYADSASQAFEFLDETRKAMDFDHDEPHHRRGSFPAVHYGISYGQGAMAPHWLKCGHEETMQKVLTNEHVIRLATFASYAFSMWAPRVYSYYDSYIRRLTSKMANLKWTFYNSVWQCVTFNLGPRVCCNPHRDFLNLPFGWCSITSLGRFDFTKGGHLVLHDLKLLIEFPPGSLILIPSALLTHGNTPISPGEQRMSFTQYCAGGLFRFVDNGFRTEKALKKADPGAYALMLEQKAKRKEMGIGLWSTVAELLKPVEPL